MSISVIRPAQRPNLAGPTSRQGQQPEDRHRRRRRRPAEGRTQMHQFRRREETLPVLSPRALDAATGIGAFRAETIRLSFLHDDGQHRHGAIGRHERRLQ